MLRIAWMRSSPRAHQGSSPGLGVGLQYHVQRTRVHTQSLCSRSFRSNTSSLNQVKSCHVQYPLMGIKWSTNSANPARLSRGVQHSRRFLQTTNYLLKGRRRSKKNRGNRLENRPNLERLRNLIGNSNGLVKMENVRIRSQTKATAEGESEVHLTFKPIQDKEHAWINKFMPTKSIIGRNSSGRLKTEASTDAYHKFVQLQKDVVAQSRLVFSSANVAGPGTDTSKWNADSRNRFLSLNDSLQVKSTSSYVPQLDLSAVTATLQFPKTNSEDVQKFVRMFGSDSISCTVYGVVKKHTERDAANAICAQLIRASGQAVGPRAVIPGFSVAEMVKEEADKAQVFLEFASMNPIHLDAKQVKKGYLAAFGELYADNVGVHTPISFKGRRPGATLAVAKNLAIIEADKELQKILPERYGHVLDIHNEAVSKQRRILPMKVPNMHEKSVQSLRGKLGSRQEICDRLEMLEEDSIVHANQPQNEPRRQRRVPDNFDDILHHELHQRRDRIPEMMAARDQLPIVALRNQLHEALQSNQVVVISGGTGSGKSTQIPQYILDDAIANKQGTTCNLLVTQPRRIAATSVAQRVAQERGEKIGHSTGYRVRLLSSRPRDHGSIEFCTTGVMLRQLQADPLLTNISHVLVDEVHERDINTDFLLLLLKDVLKARPYDFKLILMSATLDAAAFSDYFGGVPLVEVPSVTRHPVEEFYVEDLLKIKGFTQRDVLDVLSAERESITLDKEALLLDARPDTDDSKSSKSTSNATAYVNPHLSQLVKAETEHDGLCARIAQGPVTFRKQRRDQHHVFQLTAKVISHIVAESSVAKAPPPKSYRIPTKTPRRATKPVTFEEVLATATTSSIPVEHDDDDDDHNDYHDDNDNYNDAHGANTPQGEELVGGAGSILVFLPGMQEIKLVTSLLAKSNVSRRMHVLPLHSTLPYEEQRAVFDKAPLGKTKVILATNIAESSVTIDDAFAVVDSGKVRELTYDNRSRLSVMSTVQTSRASATQRKGRTGRVAPGVCYKIYSRPMLEAMRPRTVPEIQRAELQHTCLQTKALLPNKRTSDVLGAAMDPPSLFNTNLALDRLTNLGALHYGDDDKESLTLLGQRLANLPLEPRVGKMLMYGLVMQCVQPACIAAAILTSQGPYGTAQGMRALVIAHKQRYGVQSDLGAAIMAVEDWEHLRATKGKRDADDWAREHGLFFNRLGVIAGVKRQLLDEMVKMRLIKRNELNGAYGAEGINKYSDTKSMRNALCLASSASNIAWKPRANIAKGLRTTRESTVTMAISSMNNPMYARQMRDYIPSNEYFKGDWFTFSEMVQNDQKELRDTTAINASEILLFGGDKLKATDKDQALAGRLDSWILVQGDRPSFDYLLTLRSGLNCMLLHKIKDSVSTKRRGSEEEEETLDPVLKQLEQWQRVHPKDRVEKACRDPFERELDDSFRDTLLEEIMFVLDNSGKVRHLRQN